MRYWEEAEIWKTQHKKAKGKEYAAFLLASAVVFSAAVAQPAAISESLHGVKAYAETVEDEPQALLENTAGDQNKLRTGSVAVIGDVLTEASR